MKKFLAVLLFAFATMFVFTACSDDEVCTDGDCICVEGGDCDFECTDGTCSQQCEKDSSCNVTCEAGNCSQQCQAGATCDLSCAGGGCSQQCMGSSTCTATCSGGNCSSDDILSNNGGANNVDVNNFGL